MSKNEAMLHWKENAERNLAEAKKLYTDNHYDWSLFVGQLALEKILKGYIVHVTDQAPPFSHDLVALAGTASLICSEQQQEQLAVISRFNIEARYDKMKNEFYKIATKEYAQQWLGIISDLFVWIRNMY